MVAACAEMWMRTSSAGCTKWHCHMRKRVALPSVIVVLSLTVMGVESRFSCGGMMGRRVERLGTVLAAGANFRREVLQS